MIVRSRLKGFLLKLVVSLVVHHRLVQDVVEIPVAHAQVRFVGRIGDIRI